MYDKDQLQQQIDILKQVKELRQSGQNDSPYVCDNIRIQVCDCEYPPACEAITEDIDKYINGSFSVRHWLASKNDKHYDNKDPIVEKARIEMIDTLIARYTEQLEAA